MFKNNSPYINKRIVYSRNGLRHSNNIIITQWDLIAIQYYSMFYSNDSKEKLCNENTLYELCSLFLEYKNIDHYSAEEEMTDEDFILRLFIGLSQKQFWFYDQYRSIESFNRNTEIIKNGINKFDSININDICNEEIGFDYEQLSILHWGLYALSFSNSDLTNYNYDDSVLKFSEHLTKENIDKLINYYTGNYSYYRTSICEENSLFIKPIIQTSNRTFFSNNYLISRKLYEGPYWLIREHFFRKNSNEFNILYGKYFEEYISNLLSNYLTEGDYEKINEDENNQADWKIESDKYVILVEQKSSLLPLPIRNEFPELAIIEKYLEVFKKAIIQLDSTASEQDTDKNIIKLILHNEYLEIGESIIKERLLSQMEGEIQSIEDIYFINTGDFEILIYLLSCELELFNTVMERKKEIEGVADINTNKEFYVIYNELNCNFNDYIENKINHFKEMKSDT